MKAELRRVYWEMTAGCNLRCTHCRRTDVLMKGSPDELTTAEAKGLIDQLAEMGKSVLIFSGGEPLSRKDFLEIARYAKARGLPAGLATNGTLVRSGTARALREAGIYYASVSLDGADPGTHDAFRGKGNFARALSGARHLKNAGIKVQINFTVTRRNVGEVEGVYKLAESFGACALYLFLLVPVGCGVNIAPADMLSADEVESWLELVREKEKESVLPIRTICAPHYYRVAAEDGEKTGKPERRGCLAGINMCFISHKGEVFPCGYLPVSSGNVRSRPLKEIWENSALFGSLRDPELLEGRCGACAYKVVCGGCRARAFYAQENVLAEEPYCSFDPKAEGAAKVAENTAPCS